jgi:hypothetical protein
MGVRSKDVTRTKRATLSMNIMDQACKLASVVLELRDGFGYFQAYIDLKLQILLLIGRDGSPVLVLATTICTSNVLCK